MLYIFLCRSHVKRRPSDVGNRMPQSGGNGAATAGANRGGGGGGSGCKVASLGGKSASLPSHVVDGAPVLDPLGWFTIYQFS